MTEQDEIDELDEYFKKIAKKLVDWIMIKDGNV